MGWKGILYLKNRTLPSLDDLILHCRINDYHVTLEDEEDFRYESLTSSDDYDIILLDYPLRSRTRIKEILELRKELSLPLIMLMTSFKESAQIEAFSEGADDIVDRDRCSENVFALMKRMDNLISVYGKSREEAEKKWIIADDLISLNIQGRLVSVNGRDIHLTPTEWNILRLLSEKNGKVVSREAILARCFEYQYEGYDRSIDAHVKNLRKKIPPCIETMRGVGYRFYARELGQTG